MTRLKMIVGSTVLLAVVAAGCRPEPKPLPLEHADSAFAESDQLPPVPREFRAAWVATVANIDWPSEPGLTTDEQKAEFIEILDQSAALNLNAIIFQVRPVADALYASPTEPWSSYLTGTQGQAPEPLYDPLAFAVAEAHARGIELHAWFNPFRAKHASTSNLAENHVANRHPEWVRTYGRQLWLDPGEPAVIDYVMDVLRDMVERYDIDGVHVDDYFYPYQIRDDQGQIVDFPDDPTWEKYRAAGGELARDDWRRSNVDQLVQRMYETVKDLKPHVKVGISPFGIWRPGNPEQIQGLDSYATLYGDSKRWVEEGWLDYFTPQLYWPIEQYAQSYPVLLRWWVEQNEPGRHVWPGNFTSGVGRWPVTEIANQIHLTRAQPGATGNVHFSMKPLMQNRAGIADALQQLYALPAVIPASPWLDAGAPPTPTLAVSGPTPGGVAVVITPAEGEAVTWWVVQARYGLSWNTMVLPGAQNTMDVASHWRDEPLAALAVTPIDRCGNAGQPAVLMEGDAIQPRE